MKRIEDALCMSSEGMKPVTTYDVWNKKIGGLDFRFALHADPSPSQPFIRDLRISELSTGFDTDTKILHPVHRLQLTEAALKTLSPRQVKQAARAALHNHLNKVGHENFITAVLRAQMQAAKLGAGELPDTELGKAVAVQIKEGKDAPVTAD